MRNSQLGIGVGIKSCKIPVIREQEEEEEEEQDSKVTAGKCELEVLGSDEEVGDKFGFLIDLVFGLRTQKSIKGHIAQEEEIALQINCGTIHHCISMAVFILLESPQRGVVSYGICMDNIGGRRRNFLTAYGLKYPNSNICTKEMVQLYRILNFEVEPNFHLEDNEILRRRVLNGPK